jgi:hypothetical protein
LTKTLPRAGACSAIEVSEAGEASSRREQRAQTFPVGRIQQADAELALEPVVAHAPAFLPEAQRHRREQRRGFFEWYLRRRVAAEQLRGEGERIAGRARLVVGDIEDAADLAGKGRVDRLRNVGDVDAVEDLAGLDDPARVSLFDLDQGILSGSVDAGEAQDGDRGAAPCAEPLPRPLGIKPRAAARPAIPR